MANPTQANAKPNDYSIGKEGRPLPPERSAAEQVMENIGKIYGDSGTRRFSGYILEDYNALWQNSDRVALVEEMRRGDGACAAALRALKTPLLGAKWGVHTSGSGPRDEEIRAFVQDNLFGMRGRSWEDFLREALGYLDFGHYPFEFVWEIREGRVWLRDLAPRIPRSIQRWKLMDGRPGIVQFVETDEAPNAVIEIPMDKLFVLTNGKEGDDLTGISVLRPGYKHYYLKELLYKIQAMSAERFGVGVPTVTMSESPGADDKTAAEDMARNTRSNEEGYVVLPNGWLFKITTPDGNPQGDAVISAIDHHNKMILMSVFAQFLGLGTDGKGSYGLSKDHSDFFLESINDFGRYFTGQVDAQIIRKIVDVNFGEQETYPCLRYDPLNKKDVKEFADALSVLANAGFVQPNARTMEAVNDALELPEMSDDELEAIEERDAEAMIAQAAPQTAPAA